MFAALFSPDADDGPALLAAARAFSPRIEQELTGRLVIVDAAGLTRIVGDADTIARELRRHAGGLVRVHVAVAPARIAAMLLAVAQPFSVVYPGQTRAAVGALTVDVLEALAKKGDSPRFRRTHAKTGTVPTKTGTVPCALCRLAGSRACGQPGGACTELPTLRRWGIATLGELAALPSADLAARLGQPGVALQRLARGLDLQPLLPIVDEARFEASFDLEWPLETIEPLSFVLTRMLDPLSAALERADRGAAALDTTLALVTHSTDATGARVRDTHARRLELPAPMRDARVLRTLILLDLESHPPAAGIDRVQVRIEPTPGRIVQFSLLERAGPQPETIATLTSRLTALMGESRVGSPVLLDTHRADRFALTAFGSQVPEARYQRPGTREQVPEGNAEDAERRSESAEVGGVLRRFRLRVVARVTVDGERPVHVTTDRVGIRGGAVKACAGPWRSSGAWWDHRDEAAWDRDEYDVWLADGAAYRLCRDRHEGEWFIDGILD